jgi:hypothetical protein
MVSAKQAANGALHAAFQHVRQSAAVALVDPVEGPCEDVVSPPSSGREGALGIATTEAEFAPPIGGGGKWSSPHARAASRSAPYTRTDDIPVI